MRLMELKKNDNVIGRLLLIMVAIVTFSSVAFTQNLKEAEKYRSQGQKQFDQANYDQAFKLFSKEKTIRKKAGDVKGEALASIYAASALQEDERIAKSVRLLKTALETGLNLKDNNIVGTCYGMLANAYKELGEDRKAREYYTNYKNYEGYVENKKLKRNLTNKESVMQEIRQELEETEASLEKTEIELEQAEIIARNRKIKLKLLAQEKELKQAELDRKEVELDKKRIEAEKQKIQLQNERLIIYSLLIVVLLVLGLLAMAILGYRRKQRDSATIKYQNDKIVSSIEYASSIQNAILPPITGIQSALPDSFVMYRPVDLVSGDFYFFYKIPDQNRFFISVIDCTGHGVPGALMSMIGHKSLREVVLSGEENVANILSKLHDNVVEALNQAKTDNKDGMDLAFCHVDLDKKLLQYAGARNPLVYVQDGKVEVIEATRRPIGGVYHKPLPEFELTEISIDKTTEIYLFSDGYTDQFGGEKGRKFYSKNLYKLIEKVHAKPLSQQHKIFSSKFDEWRGADYIQVDDVTLIGFRISS